MNETPAQERIPFKETWVSELFKYHSIISPTQINPSDDDLEMAISPNHRHYENIKNVWCDKEYLLNELIKAEDVREFCSEKSFRNLVIIVTLLSYPLNIIAGLIGFLVRILQLVD